MSTSGHRPVVIPLTRPVLGEEELAAVRGPLTTGWVTQGPEVAAFEREFAAVVGAPHACAVSNCTAALHLALRAAGAGPGTEVITVSHTFIATANAVTTCGARPVFVDVEPDTFNMAAGQVEARIGPQTAAILCVHQMGLPCDLGTLAALARDRGIPLIEDAACAVGSTILWNDRWEPIGRPHGDVCCFSFHPRKVLTTGEGGMMTTAREDWDLRFRRWRQHAMSVPDTVRHDAEDVIFEAYPEVGFNYRMTDIQAAIGRRQLERLPDLVAERRRLAQRYHPMIAELEGCTPPSEPEWARSNWQSYCVRLPEGCDQRAVMRSMLERGVSTRRGIMCVHLEAPYRGQPLPQALPHSEVARDGAIVLPIFPGMTDTEQDTVVEALAESCAAARCHVGV